MSRFIKMLVVAWSLSQIGGCTSHPKTPSNVWLDDATSGFAPHKFFLVNNAIEASAEKVERNADGSLTLSSVLGDHGVIIRPHSHGAVTPHDKFSVAVNPRSAAPLPVADPQLRDGIVARRARVFADAADDSRLTILVDGARAMSSEGEDENGVRLDVVLDQFVDEVQGTR